jgi:hypothetical protein
MLQPLSSIQVSGPLLKLVHLLTPCNGIPLVDTAARQNLLAKVAMPLKMLSAPFLCFARGRER